MKKHLLCTTFFLLLFLTQNLKAQSLDSVVTTTPILCNGDLATVTAYMTQTAPGTPVKLMNYIFNPGMGQYLSNGSSGVTTGATQPFPGMSAANYRMLMVDSIPFYTAFPMPPGPPPSELQNPSDPSIFGYIDYTVSEPLLFTVTETTTDASTPFSNDGSIVVNVSGGTPGPGYIFAWIGPNGFTSANQNISNLFAGTYNLTVTDNASCTYFAMYDVDVMDSCGITHHDSTDVLCNGDSSGIISVSGVWGTAPFQYSATNTTGYVFTSPVTSDTFFVFNTIPAGDYRIKITDNVGCTDSISPDITINEPSLINSITVVTGASALMACDGSIQSNVFGGIPPYTYLWTNQSTLATQIGNPATGLCGPEEYCVTVTDANGCITDEICDSVRIIPPCIDSIQLTVTVHPETCRGGDGSLQISAVGGNALYYYSINNGLSFDTTSFISLVLIDSLIAGNYVVIVKDSFCTADSSLVIEVMPNPIITSAPVINESCCGDDGQIIVFTNNDLAIVKYSIDTLFSWQDSAVFSNLDTGYYWVHIEDTNACTDSIQVYVGFETVPDIDMTTQVFDVRCHGDTSGMLKLLAPPDSCYDYVLWSYTLLSPLVAIDTGSSFPDLTVGWYGIIATSKSGNCIAYSSSAGEYIDEPGPIVYNEPISSAVYCMNNDSCNGSIALDGLPTGGIPPYYYSVQKANTNTASATIPVNSTFFGICPGEYEVQVFDANACPAVDTILVLDSSLYIDSLITTNISCLDSSDAIITVYSHGGLGPYSYSWSNGDTTQTIDSLSPGFYNVEVTDSATCFALDSVVIIQPDSLIFAIKPNGKIPETCMGVTYDGQILLEITGGTVPHNYSWIGNSGITGSGFGDTMTSLTYDLITISVSDANGCTGLPFWIQQPSAQVDALNATNPLILANPVLIGNSPMCFGSANGTIQINIVQGVAPYQYSIDNGITKSLNNTFSNLIALPYNIVVYDTFGCTEDTTVWLEDYDEIIIKLDSIKDINCYGGSDGYISVSASGGIGNFSYLWSTGATTNFLSNLSMGTYSVQVTDSVGCMVMDTITLKHLTNPIQSSDLVIDNVNCFGVEDGSASIQIIGGMPFENGVYTVSWINSTNDTVSTGNFADSLASGVYLIAVTDSFLCSFTDTISITQPSPFYLDTINIKHPLCKGFVDGEISVTAFGGTVPYINYFINDALNGTASSNSPVFTGLAESSYSLWSVDANGCNSDTLPDIRVRAPGKIIAQTTVSDLSCFQSNDGVIELSILSGKGPYQYQLLDGNIVLAQGNVDTGIVFSIFDLSASSPYFILHISDYNACEIDTQIIVNQPDEVVASFVANDDLGRKSFTTSFENFSSEGADVFFWDFADGISETQYGREEVVHTFINQGEYIVQLIAHNSNLSVLCNDTASLIVDVEGYDVFNVFSPNGDGDNDVFYFDNWMLKEIDVEIFNRWGQQVYHWSGVYGSWDGRGYNGENLSEGVYFYSMNAQGADDYSFQEKGSITLLR